MRRSAFLLIIFLTAALAYSTAQATPSAYGRQLQIRIGATGSFFAPHDAHNSSYYSDGSKLFGVGTYVDTRLSHWVQIEAEGRWLRWNGMGGEHMDQYLIGPRVPIKEFRRSQIYGKALIGMGKMTFPFGYGYGTFTDLAFGGTYDYDITPKLTVRAVDFEYQYWPVWLNNQSLSPYGISAGISYRVF